MGLTLPPGNPDDIRDRRGLGSRQASILRAARKPTGSRAHSLMYWQPSPGPTPLPRFTSNRPAYQPKKRDVNDAMLAAISARFQQALARGAASRPPGQAR
jgi:hypothetical protein